MSSNAFTECVGCSKQRKHMTRALKKVSRRRDRRITRQQLTKGK